MATKTRQAVFETVADVLASLGGVSPDRVLVDPVPGTATEKDVLQLYDNYQQLFELVDGTLVEKVMGIKEALLAMYLGHLLITYSEENGGVGIVAGESGMLRLKKKLVRIPDVAFTRYDRLPNREVPDVNILELAPDLAVEVLSKKNTKREMARKLKDYFQAGVRLVWYIEPRTRSARVYTSPDDTIEVGPTGTLDGGDVFPGLRISLQTLFERSGVPASRSQKARKKPRE